MSSKNKEVLFTIHEEVCGEMVPSKARPQKLVNLAITSYSIFANGKVFRKGFESKDAAKKYLTMFKKDLDKLFVK